jgi:hypothetical protein
MTAPELKEISGNQGIVFRQTMVSLDHEGGAKLYTALMDRTKTAHSPAKPPT